jgi:hypothetical protein
VNLKALPVKVVAVAVGVALVAKAVAVVRLAPKAQQDAHAMVLPPHVAAAPLKAHAEIVKIVQKEILMARLPIVSTTAMTATTTDAMTVALVATNCHVTLIR